MCKKEFQGRTQLQVHLNLHSGLRPYACEREECSKTFRSNAALKKHMRIHILEKPFQCPQVRTNHWSLRLRFKKVLIYLGIIFEFSAMHASAEKKLFLATWQIIVCWSQSSRMFAKGAVWRSSNRHTWVNTCFKNINVRSFINSFT